MSPAIDRQSLNHCAIREVPVSVFLMYLWGEMNSTSSYSSTLLTPLLISNLVIVTRKYSLSVFSLLIFLEIYLMILQWFGNIQRELRKNVYCIALGVIFCICQLGYVCKSCSYILYPY